MQLPESPLWVAASCAVLIQIAKFVADGLSHRRVNFQRLVQTGGMPSSHAGSVAALTTSVGLASGFESLEFQLAAFFSVIIVYDAAGLRRAAGHQAVVLNRIVDRMQREHRLVLGQGRLAELLGHTPFEVFVGIFLGIFFALAWQRFV